jgi:hypothetical protein
MPFTLRVTTFNEKTLEGSIPRGETITKTKRRRKRKTTKNVLRGVGGDREKP